MEYIFKLRRDTSAQWLEINPVLAAGEPGVETDTGQLKVGNGYSTWSNLPYSGSGSLLLQDHVDALLPHPVYDDGPSLSLLYENAKV